jgi:predicted alpha/beta hydrolase
MSIYNNFLDILSRKLKSKLTEETCILENKIVSQSLRDNYTLKQEKKMKPNLLPTQQESLFVSLSNGRQMHLRHIWTQAEGPVVWMVHGAIENGRIFYTHSGKGLACFLARAGYHVYVSDLGGRGQSTPAIGKDSTYSQTECILSELPAINTWLKVRHAGAACFWIAHSWGGVLLFAHLARMGYVPAELVGVICFATKRQVLVQNWDRWLRIEAVWKRFAYLLTTAYGYLPAKQWKLGSDNESKSSHAQSVAWVKPSPWIDPEDGFDYVAALKTIDLPPALFLTGVADKCLGHAQDVQTFMAELNHPQSEFQLIGKSTGHLHDYNHIDLLTHPQAPQDHFQAVLHWMEKKQSP